MSAYEIVVTSICVFWFGFAAGILFAIRGDVSTRLRARSTRTEEDDEPELKPSEIAWRDWKNKVGKSLTPAERESVLWARSRMRGEDTEAGPVSEARQILDQYAVPRAAR